ncbi:lysozyme inhibitor LprI family protein [Acinetobacter soli]|uniref:lysozyme inhibitor LprI family protein n=1 Tax=Acinetobacter soli TaxID=487316 RepID=UPI0035C90A05
MRRSAFIMFTWCGLMFAGAASAASFPCEKAQLRSEKTICQTRSLNDADVKMATTYAIVLHALPMGGRDAEKGMQYQWLKQRNTCGSNTSCLSRSYASRQQHLDDIIQNRVLSHGPF